MVLTHNRVCVCAKHHVLALLLAGCNPINCCLNLTTMIIPQLVNQVKHNCLLPKERTHASARQLCRRDPGRHLERNQGMPCLRNQGFGFMASCPKLVDDGRWVPRCAKFSPRFNQVDVFSLIRCQHLSTIFRKSRRPPLTPRSQEGTKMTADEAARIAQETEEATQGKLLHWYFLCAEIDIHGMTVAGGTRNTGTCACVSYALIHLNIRTLFIYIYLCCYVKHIHLL